MTRHQSQEARRRQIMDAARHSFVERGYAQTRMSDIARDAGLSKGGLYFHFAAKRDIFDALVDDVFDSTMADLRSVQSQQGATIDKLAALGGNYLAMSSTSPDTSSFLFVIAEMAIREPPLLARLRDLHHRYLDALTEMIEDGIENGQLRPVEASTAAILLKALVDGLDRQIAMGDSLDLPAVIRAGADIIMRGLATDAHASTSPRPRQDTH